MANYEHRKVLVTDYAWENLQPERKVLSKVGADLVVASSGKEEELVKLAKEVVGILTCWARVTPRVVNAAKKCQVIGRYGIGVDNIAVEEATKLGIIVTNVPSYCTDEVSEHAMALLLNCARKVSFYDRTIKRGEWDIQSGNRMFRLRGKILGLIGFGKIAQALVPKAQAFGLNIVAFDPYISEKDAQKYGVKMTLFDELLKSADFISVHVPLTNSTYKLLDETAFKKMKNTAYVINTSRGAVVDTTALVRAVKEGWIAGAGLDVLPKEPPDTDEPVLCQENISLTPHAAFCSVESLIELETKAAKQIALVLQRKEPEYIVNQQVLNSPRLRASLQK
ncbi:C-terminal binding protein [Candidatus Aerophobetes bacterium]|nr:C-terminal binding protein [Candidatus Aerophobetes bacterium]